MPTTNDWNELDNEFLRNIRIQPPCNEQDETVRALHEYIALFQGACLELERVEREARVWRIAAGLFAGALAAAVYVIVAQ